MRFWVGTTDNRWFDFLATNHFDEVNFWQPSVIPPFKQAPMGMPFLSKLKRPHNHIAGGGFFVQHSAIPLSLAWEIFGPKNGAVKGLYLFGRIQLIRKLPSAGGEYFARLEINESVTIKKLLPITSNPQLDAFFNGLGGQQ